MRGKKTLEKMRLNKAKGREYTVNISLFPPAERPIRARLDALMSDWKRGVAPLDKGNVFFS
jgi:hypothetical protein